MRRNSLYRAVTAILIGRLCSEFITPILFSDSFLDAVLPATLGACSSSSSSCRARTNEAFTQLFEIVVALLSSFIAVTLASTERVCYAAVASGSGSILILPGFIVLTGALELASRDFISGRVQVMYSLSTFYFSGSASPLKGDVTRIPSSS
ncbi:hypothetical protein CALVIDRAFT_370685 [Calocera viscosa TUFC12733]|uniref:Threonine/serine exporter-like N-terminal domain-containing protein n=1 Tax=Calocera viscosa (strain TUFC12733) TaxID=1330018 RepID=A0A167GV76_CALVF|nr:hypothetical protein CALVIDRAFT_370685 [Calocera viscosa TUFC12733]